MNMITQKLLAVLIAAVMLFTLLPMSAFAALGDTGTTADGFVWRENEGTTATITGYTGTDTVIAIPGTVDNNGTSLSVCSIGSNAFSGINITAVTIPASVIDIGMRALYQCTELTAINIPAAVEYIDEQAFDGCTSLATVTFGAGSSLEFIGGGAFSETALTSINIPAGVSTIREGAFMGCSRLASINIPDGVTSIRDEMFSGCSALTSIDIPAGVTSFGYNVFDGCAALTSITIPSGVTSIGYNAFRGCASLTSITIPSGVTSIQNETLSGCTNLAAVNFATGTILNAIGNSAFQGCVALSSITIPTDVNTIGSNAFQGCTNLATVNIDADVSALNTIGSSAFQDCTALSSITIPRYMNTIGNSAFQGCTSLSSVNFVDDAASQPKTIGSSAFQGCSALTSVNIPRRVSSIGSSAFQGCTSLVKATVKSKNATFGSNVFYDAALGSDGVYGYKNSTADTYCKENSIPFHYITDGETVITTTSLPNGTINEPYNQTLARIGDAASVTWSIDSGSLPDSLSLDAGTGVISGTPTALGSSTFTVNAVNNNDAGDNDTQELTITISKGTPTAADLTYDLTAVRTYNGSAQPITVTGPEGLGTITIKYDGNNIAPTNAGTYVITADIAEGTNYGPAAGITLGNYTIGKAVLTISGGTVAAKTYDGTADATITSVAFSGLQNIEMLTMGTDYTVIGANYDNGNADAGNNKTVRANVILLDTAKAGNYSITNAVLTLYGQIIGKADFTVPNVNKNVQYSNTGSQTVDIAVLVADKKLSGDTLIYQAGNVTGANPNIIQSKSTDAAGTLNFTISGGTVGDTATISVTVSGLTNYNDVTVNVVVTLTDKIPVTVNLPAPDKTYDGNPAAAFANASGIPDGDFNYIWLDSNGSQLADNIPPTNAGSYQVMAEISGNSALTYIGEAAISFTIARKTITVRADDKSVTQGGVLPTPTVSYFGFVGTDSSSNALTTQAAARLGVTNSNTVGTSAIDFATQAVLNNTIGADYTLSHVNGTLTITSRNSGSGGGATPTSRYEASVSGSSGSVKIEVKVYKNNASAELSLAQTAKGKNISVTMPKIPGVTSYTLGIPITCLSWDDGNGSITLNTDAGSITLPSNMLTGTEAASGNKVQVSIGTVKPGDLPKDAQDKVGNRPIISLSISIDSKTVAWENSNAPVTVSIPYTPTAEELKSPEVISIWYIDGSGKLTEVSGAKYDSSTGMVVFQTTHFSYFAVGYNAPTPSFNDVIPGAWYYDAVTFIAAKGITTGTGDGKFSPEATLTRGQFIVMLMKAYDIGAEKNHTDNFSDAGNTYYTGYLAAAKRLGISAGVGNNLYAPDKAITRQEMFTLLYNALKVIGQLPRTHGRAVDEVNDQPQGSSNKTLYDFTDAVQIDTWAKDAMTLLVETGIVGGNDGKLSPTSTTTRAEMAQVLYNLLGK